MKRQLNCHSNFRDTFESWHFLVANRQLNFVTALLRPSYPLSSPLNSYSVYGFARVTL